MSIIDKTLPISVIILTYNEEKHIRRAIESVSSLAEDIFVIDSFSQDDTIKIAKSLGVKILQNKWINQATQFNWSLENAPIRTNWIMRLDADEYVTDELQREIAEKLHKIPPDITGLYVKRRVYFMGRWIKHGGYYPTWLLRIWRRGKGFCEKRWMDEHIKIKEGKTLFLENDIVEFNEKPLYWWIEKHNSYATREAIDMLNIKLKFLNQDNIESSFFGTQEQRKRWLKERIYVNLPLFLRSFLYFCYRYFLKCGFLDGIQGLIWHFLQGFWYRFLVDAKIYEIKNKAKKEDKSIKDILKELDNIYL
jgi:glycosyltransferase involved in cell wall biosynthesis